MLKEDLNKRIRDFVSNEIDLTEKDRKFISQIYDSIIKVLGNGNTLQVGSYARAVSVKPLHDLDILYVLGKWDEDNIPNPTSELQKLKKLIDEGYTAPSDLIVKVKLQTHSITIILFEKNEEVFSIDIVPAYIHHKNEFNEDMYKVPELLYLKHSRRNNFYEKSFHENHIIKWIDTDPRGYIKIVQDLNEKHPDIRTAIKFLKGWKNSCKKIDDTFKFKSFHIEQIVIDYFTNYPKESLCEIIFRFMTDLKIRLDKPMITDRADPTKFIDSYITENDFKFDLVIQARDFFMTQLEDVIEDVDITKLLQNNQFYKRYNIEESYLFDSAIFTFIDPTINFKIQGYLEKHEGFREYTCPISVVGNKVKPHTKIKFQIIKQSSNSYLSKWKVRNDINSEQIRGEITNNKTRNDPETAVYIGKHFVEAYLIENNICIAKDKCYIEVCN